MIKTIPKSFAFCSHKGNNISIVDIESEIELAKFQGATILGSGNATSP